MHIIVCMKQVPDPEGPREAFEINQTSGLVEPRGIPPVLSLFDENALEMALRIKDVHPAGAMISVLSMGKRISNAVMLKALAAGADEIVKVEDEALDAGRLDSFATAHLLAAAIRKTPFDLIITGRQAADFNDGQVGIGLAHILDLPVITVAHAVTVQGRELRAERVLAHGYEVMCTPMPAVIMASNEVGELRYPSMIQRREAKQKPVHTWRLADIGLVTPPARRLARRRLFAPELRERRCRIFSGSIPADAGRNLALQLKEDRVI
ncbi:MAG: electron transfer flavoprotein subunit beta/FixA family protein [Syntrophaceae bacterium]